MASYACDMGYRLVGDAVLTCQSVGQFSGEEPTCNGEYLATVFSLMMVDTCANDLLYHLINLLTVIDCGLLPLLMSEGQVAYTPGVVTGLETGLNATASYSCSEGYSLVGDMTRTCQANGQWDGAETTCMCECINQIYTASMH